METPPTRARPPLPVSADDLRFRTIGREFADLFRSLFGQVRHAFGQLGRALAAVYRAARNPETSRDTLKAVFRALLRTNICYGAVLVVVMPLAGGGERQWQIVLTATVVCVVVEMILAGEWFGGSLKPEKVSLVKAPRP